MIGRNILYIGTVFLTGVAVLILEIAAIRLLSLQFGTSLTVISSVITIVLLALSLGYYIGGRLSDTYPDPKVLYGAIFCSGITTLILTSAAYFVFQSSNIELTLFSPLLSAFLIFFLPAFILGLDSPFVIKLMTNGTPSEKHGSIVGTVFFWSTLGSIVGSLSIGFFLLPAVGLLNTFLYTGMGLTALGIFGASYFYIEQRTIPTRTVLLITFFGAALSAGIFFGARSTLLFLDSELSILTRYDGLYSHIIVRETEIAGRTVRLLHREANASSAIFPGSSDIVFDYLRLLPEQMKIVDNPKSMLFLGGGAYTGPKVASRLFPEMEIEVVEIEPSLFSLAQEYFELPVDNKIKNHVADGRIFAEDTDRQFDIIYLDTHNSGHFLPPTLTTKEFFTTIKNRLSPNGILLINFIGTPTPKESASVTGSFVTTLESVFPNVTMYAMEPNTLHSRQNIVFQTSNTLARDDTFLNPAAEIFMSFGTTTPQEMLIEPQTLTNEEDTIFYDNQSQMELLVGLGRW